MKIPTQKYCMDLYDQYVVPPTIRNHCLSVRRVAVFLATKLKDCGISLDIDIVDRLALLHDAFKMAAIKNVQPSKLHPRPFTKEELEVRDQLREKYPGKYEGEIAYEILKEEYSEFAKLLLHATNPHNKDRCWEDSILHYCDYRTFKNTVVTLETRFEYFKTMYNGFTNWDIYLEYMKEEENKIFSELQFKPEELKELVEAETSIQLLEE